MNTITFSACDCCGKRFGKREKFGLMEFVPRGANFLVRYAACMDCVPQIPQNVELTNAAMRKCIERVPELFLYANVGGTA